MARLTRPAGTVPAPILLLTGIASVQIGNAWADSLFGRVGAGGAGLLRLGWAMFVLVAIYRPRLTGRGRSEWWPAAGLGCVLAPMNLTFYHAIARIPLGIAVTVEFIGPLAVAIAHSRRRRDLLWAGLAAVGILALAHGSGQHLDPLGLLLAGIAGCLWGLYILLQARVGRAFADGSGLALAMLVATAVAIPDGVVEGGARLLSPGVLTIGVAVGLLSSVIPYSIELVVLRRLSPGIFGVLMSLEPAAAALAGAVVIGQALTLRELAGMVLVSAASLGASVTGTRGGHDRTPTVADPSPFGS
ncbi:DMT family transporter [Conexibacter sp. DBS9H8]|uniref:EamA family transporter n=1 Tax=Conexibacter sp. DBS9H8 TaxID=2937801 RepID=UPI00200BD963|nr:EamA family transporter [Conexibacter sp. DBS9H8]